MGRITIEIPQDGEFIYRVRSEERVKKLKQILEQIEDREREEDDDILGLWTNPEPIVKAAKQ